MIEQTVSSRAAAVEPDGKGHRPFFDDLCAALHFGRFWRVVEFEHDDFVAARAVMDFWRGVLFILRPLLFCQTTRHYNVPQNSSKWLYLFPYAILGVTDEW